PTTQTSRCPVHLHGPTAQTSRCPVHLHGPTAHASRCPVTPRFLSFCAKTPGDPASPPKKTHPHINSAERHVTSQKTHPHTNCAERHVTPPKNTSTYKLPGTTRHTPHFMRG